MEAERETTSLTLLEQLGEKSKATGRSYRGLRKLFVNELETLCVFESVVYSEEVVLEVSFREIR